MRCNYLGAFPKLEGGGLLHCNFKDFFHVSAYCLLILGGISDLLRYNLFIQFGSKRGNILCKLTVVAQRRIVFLKMIVISLCHQKFKCKCPPC